MEDYSAGRRQRFLSSACVSWQGSLYSENEALLREVLFDGYLSEGGRVILYEVVMGASVRLAPVIFGKMLRGLSFFVALRTLIIV